MSSERPLNAVVKELEDHIKNTSGWSKKFQDAVTAAYDTGITEMKDITTTKEYLAKINEWLYWVPVENEEGRDVYNRICLFYYVMNQPTVKNLQDPISPEAINIQNSWLTDWMYRYAEELGKWLDEPDSIGAIESFWKSPPYNMKEYVEPRGGWRDFNDW